MNFNAKEKSTAFSEPLPSLKSNPKKRVNLYLPSQLLQKKRATLQLEQRAF